MSLAAFSIRRRITVLMIITGVIVFGWFSLNRLEIKLLPNITYPSITVRTDVPGAPPEEIEDLVSRPIEEALGTLHHLKEITSISRAGMSDVIIAFNWDTPMDNAVMDIREKLDTLLLPDTAEKPRILRYNPETEPIVKLALVGRDPVFMQEIARNEIKPRLETIDGVAATQIMGGEKEEIRIDVDMGKLTERHLTLADISSRLKTENINLPGGILEDGTTRFMVRTLNEFMNIDEIGNIVLGSDGSADIRLKDLAKITRTAVEPKTITHLGNRESVLIDVYKEGDANIIRVAQRIRKELNGRSSGAFARKNGLRSILPHDMRLIIVSDQSVFIDAAITEVKKTAIFGCVLAVLILFFFLRSLSHTTIIGLAIPVSIIATFTMMYFRHISLNLMSLGGLALGIGMLVDNSIVVLENIFQEQEKHRDIPEAARIGTETVSTAVIASTLTTIAVFFPIIFVTGIAGQLFNDLAWTIAFSLLASLLVSLSMIPMIASLKFSDISGNGGDLWIAMEIRERGWNTVPDLWKRMIRGLRQSIRTIFRSGSTRSSTAGFLIDALLFVPRLVYLVFVLISRLTGQFLIITTFLIAYPSVRLVYFLWKMLQKLLTPFLNLFSRTLERMTGLYRRSLNTALNFPDPILATTIVVFALIMFLAIPRLGMNLIPTFSQGEIFIDLRLPVGTSLGETEATTGKLERSLLENPMVERVSAVIGTDISSGTSVGVEEENLATIHFLLKKNLRDKSHETRIMETLRRQIAGIPGIEKFEFRRPALFSLSTPIQLEVRGDDLAALRKNARMIAERMSREPEFTDTAISQEEGYPEIQITFDRLRLARLGMSPSTVADMLHDVIEGDVATTFGEIRSEVDIRIRAKRSGKWDRESLAALVINPESNPPVRLGQIADITVGKGPSEIRRIDQRRTVLVSADVRLMDLKHATEKLTSILRKYPPLPGISYAITGQNTEMRESTHSLVIALLLAMFLVYLVMASQFESLLHPFLIMFSIPLALLGVVPALLLLHIPISVVVFIGLIVLAGIVVNNAIVLIDTINQKRRDGIDLKQAVIDAGTVRLRPILMTATTTILGLLPMAIEQGAGMEIRVPLAVTVISGLLVSTFLTLFIIPLLYIRVSRRKGRA